MKKVFVTLFALFIIYNNALAQMATFKSADKAFKNQQYMDAIFQFKIILDSKPTEAKKIYFPLAFSYKKINDSKNAEKYFETLAKSDTSVISKLYYAQALAANGKYKEANEWYKKYANKNSADAKAKAWIDGYTNFENFYKDSSRIKVSLLNINSPQADFSPSFYKNGLVFSSNRKYGKTHRFFGWNNTSFLNLFYASDTAKLKPATGDLLTKLNSNSVEYPSRVHSDETRQTSNDSPVLGYLSDNNSTINTNEDTVGVKRFSSSINSKFHDGVTAFYSSGDSMLFTRNNFNGMSAKRSKDGEVKLKIYSATNKSGSWGNIKEFEYNDKNYSVGHPSISADNKTLYFISDMPGSIGGTDLYSCSWVNGKWGTPKNLGNTINTSGDEMFPYIHANGNLYFSSNGHAGLGGLDIFCFDNSKNTIANMGYPINTMKDDFGIIFSDDKNGFLSSNRKRGLSDDDIYSFYIAPPIIVKLIVQNETTKVPLPNVKVLLNDADSMFTDNLGQLEYVINNPEKDNHILFSKINFKDFSKNISSKEIKEEKDRVIESTILMAIKPQYIFHNVVKDKHTNLFVSDAKILILNQCTKVTETISSDSIGAFKFPFDPTCDYIFKVVKDSYFPHCLSIGKNQLLESTEVKTSLPIYLTKIDLNATIEIKNLYYELNKASIIKEEIPILDHLAHLLNEYDDIKVELGSHTDSRADGKYNQKLSQQRADTVVKYLTHHGVAKSRIRAKGYGERKLLNKCKDGVECLEEQHQENRRTEIKVIGFVKPNHKYPKGKSPVHHHDAPLSPSDDFSDCESVKLIAK